MSTQTVLVTGAASGIGLACTRILHGEGNQVVAFDIQGDRMREELGAGDDDLHLVSGDVSKTADCEGAVAAAVERFGRLDALVHWGATHSTARWDELDAAEWERTLSVNVTGSFLISQAAARRMVAAEAGGNIVLATSTSVLFGVTGGKGQGGPAYVSSKGAIIALTRSLARSLAPHGIRVNAVSPGLTETRMITEMTPELRAAMVKRFPLGRFGQPDEVAHAACFLISARATFITGEVIHVNGGSNFN